MSRPGGRWAADCFVHIVFVLTLFLLTWLSPAWAKQSSDSKDAIIRSQRTLAKIGEKIGGKAHHRNWRQIARHRSKAEANASEGPLEEISALVPIRAIILAGRETCPDFSIATPTELRVDEEEDSSIAIEITPSVAAGIGLLSGPVAEHRIRKLYGREARGWLVGYVAKSGEATALGLQPDDLIIEIGDADPEKTASPVVSTLDCGTVRVRVLRNSNKVESVSLTAPGDQ